MWPWLYDLTWATQPAQARSENNVETPASLCGLSTKTRARPWERVETCQLHLCLGVQREEFLFSALPPL